LKSSQLKIKNMPEKNIIFKNITLFVVPYIILYALYIQVNGEVSPGGGFQAGVIFATALIGYDLSSSKYKLKQFFPVNILLLIAASGVLVYAGTGFISIIFGYNFLNYYALYTNKHLAQSIGISAIEIGVGLTVASVMSMIYILFQKEE